MLNFETFEFFSGHLCFGRLHENIYKLLQICSTIAISQKCERFKFQKEGGMEWGFRAQVTDLFYSTMYSQTSVFRDVCIMNSVFITCFILYNQVYLSYPTVTVVTQTSHSSDSNHSQSLPNVVQ